jgi:uncharacterized protein (TIGR02145 family)
MKALKIIGVFALALMSNAVMGQSDSVYVIHGDSVVNVYPTTYVDSIIFYRPVKTNTSANTVTDINGNSYKTVTIGTQVWMAENLKVSKYNDGSAIPNVTDNSQWSALTTGAWSNYNNNSQNDNTYGKLYNWHTVNTGKLCPTGWHVPTDAEWTVLTDYLAANGHSGTEGKALKSTTGWNSNGNGTDNYGWNGLPGGYRYGNGSFDYIGYSGNWWSSSQLSTGSAWARGLYYSFDYVGRYYGSKKYGFSVRCLRD